MNKGAILKFFSIYLLEKRTLGEFHPTLFLKGRNSCLGVEKLRMQLVVSIWRDLSPGAFLISLHLKDAYLHVLFRHFTDSSWGWHWRTVNQCRVLPFGLAWLSGSYWVTGTGPSGRPSPPRDYLYGTIFFGQDTAPLVARTRNTSNRLRSHLELIFSLTKSALIPSKVMTLLGALLDMLTGIIRPMTDKGLQEISLFGSLWQRVVPLQRTYSGWLHGFIAACAIPLSVSVQTDFLYLARNFKGWRLGQQNQFPLNVPDCCGVSSLLVQHQVRNF